MVTRRHFLKEKEARQLLLQVSRSLKVNAEQLFGSKPHIESAEAPSAQIFFINGKPLLAKIEETILPTLIFNEIFPLLPKIVVNMGAVPHICNGADIMAPGIVRIEGNFNENDFVLITDERHNKPLAIGIAIQNSQTMKNLKHGKIVKNLHYVGDKLWNQIKT